jgi:hypothetical protein
MPQDYLNNLRINTGRPKLSSDRPGTETSVLSPYTEGYILNVTTTFEGGILFAVITGEYSLEDAERVFLEILEALRETDTSKVLVDGRSVTGEPSVADRFYYGEFMAISVQKLVESGWVGENPCFAFVLHEPVLDPLRLGETVAINRGVNIKAFQNKHEACRWLEQEQPA